MARNVRCHLRQESSRNTEEQDLQNSNYTRNDIWWGMLGDKKMCAKPDEHNRNEDAEMDTRKTRTYHIRYVDIREKAHTKPIHTFPMKKRLSYFGRVQWREYDDGSVASTDPVNVDFPSIKIRIMFVDLHNNKISIMFADLLNNKIRIMFADLLNNKIRGKCADLLNNKIMGSLLTCSTTISGESLLTSSATRSG